MHFKQDAGWKLALLAAPRFKSFRHSGRATRAIRNPGATRTALSLPGFRVHRDAMPRNDEGPVFADFSQ
jgi:hypothetical protein